MRKAGELKNLYELLKLQRNETCKQAIEKMIRSAEDTDQFFDRVKCHWQEFENYPPQGWENRNKKCKN